MKKNFVVKTLASTLALAMVVTAAPAMPASAAKAPALNKKSKTLYINGNDIGSSYDFNVKNKVSGSKYKWTTSNKNIATVNSKGIVNAGTKTGKATITCKITLPTKKTKTLKATVTVKENAIKAEISNPVETAKIGEEVNFNKTFTTESGAKSTDYQYWEIDEASNTAGATVVASNGKVTATKAGEYKVRVRAYQNKTKLAANDTVDSEWLTVKVAASLLTVEQASVTELTATFDDNMKDTVKASDFVIKNKATNVVSAVKGVNFSEDGKVVTVETFAQFVDGATYVVTYKEKDYEVNTTVGEVASIEIKTATVVENKETAIKYVLKNANGVDITAAKNSTVTVEATENNNGWLNGEKLTIFEKGKTAKIKVTYHTYKYNTDGTEAGAVVAEATITAVEETAATIGNYKNYVVASSQPNWNKTTENKNVICIGESGMKVFVKAVDSNNADITGLQFESGNENLILVSADGSLVPVAEGSTVIVVKNSKGTVLWTLPVVIKPERKDTTVSLANSTLTVVNNGIATASTEFKVADQYGDARTANGKVGRIEAINNAPDIVVATSGKDVNVAALSTTPEGTYQYKVFLKDGNAFTVLTVVVKHADTTTFNSYKLTLSNTTVDTIVDADSKAEDKAVTGKVIAMANGLDIAEPPVYVEVVGPDNKVVDSSTDGSFSVNYITVSGSELVKAIKGTYKVTAYEDNTKTKAIAKTAFVVNDTQVLPTVFVNNNSYNYNNVNNSGNLLAILQNNCKVVSSLGVELKTADGVGIVAYDATDRTDSKQSYVKTVKVKEQLNNNVYVIHTVTVNKTFTVQ